MRLHDRLAQIADQTAQRVQRGRTQLTGTSVTIAIDPVDPGAAAAVVGVPGCDASYAYTLAEDALTVTFAEPVQAWINWEVQG